LLQETLTSVPDPGVALDLACGTGRHALYLARQGWAVSAVDGSTTAIEILQQRAAQVNLPIETALADLAAGDFRLPSATYDLIVVAYYLQRDLFPKVRTATKPGGLVLAIVHTPDSKADISYKRAAPGELRTFFSDWQILHYYEGASRDPAHHRPVAEIVARRP
jgi:SAM-dependent methyltransferase